MTGKPRKSKLTNAWCDLLRLLPGYDPFKQAGDCWFDEAAAKHAMGFFPALIKHVEGAKAGEPFTLEPWEQSIVANLFGWKRTDGRRRYREAYLQLSRGNGKSAFGAGLALYGLCGLGEYGAQVYTAAGTRDQAGFIFRPCRAMVQAEPAFEKAGVRVMQYSIVLEKKNSVLKALTGDADSQHGANIFLAVVDELHVVGHEFWRALRTGTGKRDEPLLICTTTAGWDRESVCYQRYQYACKVRDNEHDDPSFLPVIYETKPEEDWTDPAVWRKANPNLGVSVQEDYLRARVNEAMELPSEENTFRQLHLGQWTEQAVRLIPMHLWDACTEAVVPEELEGRECYGGLDLATTDDIAAFVLVFPDDDAYKVLPFLFVPEDNARQRSRRDHVDYLKWIKSGHLICTPGNQIDYDFIRMKVNELHSTYNIRQIARDRWNASQITTQLQGDGFDMVDFGQGFASMTSPCKELLRLVTTGKLHHGGHPVLRWMASNCAGESDAAANLKLSKKKSSEKIDGIVATVMGLALALTAQRGPSIYATPGELAL